MGYEIARLVSEIDDEFLCSICTMVLENPMQSPCEHIFCNDCIIDWLKIETSCPVDRFVLAVDNLKPTPRYFRNMLDKVEVKCKFEPLGCPSIISLEHLQDHLTKCTFDPGSEIICDKGCNIKMNRRDYEVSNCITHLANTVSRQQSHFENIISRQEEQITKLNNEVVRQRDEINKLNYEMSLVRCQLNGPQKQLPQLIDQSSISLNKTTKCHWRICHNMKIAFDQRNILEYGGYAGNGFAQLFNPMDISHSFFKIRILNGCATSSMAIGLTCRNHSIDVPPGYDERSVGYRSNGELFVDKRCQNVGQEWRNGDVVECGLKYPIINDSTGSVEFYFAINEEIIFKNVIQIPHDGLYPTIFMWPSHAIAKVEYVINENGFPSTFRNRKPIPLAKYCKLNIA